MIHNRCWSLSWRPGGDHGHGPPFFFLWVLSFITLLLAVVWLLWLPFHLVCCSSLQPHAPPSGQLLLCHLSGLLHPWSGPLSSPPSSLWSSSSTANDSLWRSGWIWTRDLWHCLPVLIPLSYRSPTMHVLELILHYLPVVFDTKSGLVRLNIGREGSAERHVWRCGAVVEFACSCSQQVCAPTTGLRLPYIRHSYNHSLFGHQIITTSVTNTHLF